MVGVCIFAGTRLWGRRDSLFTSLPPDGETLDGTLAISLALNASLARGDAQFERIFTAADGLGPRSTSPVVRPATRVMVEADRG